MAVPDQPGTPVRQPQILHCHQDGLGFKLDRLREKERLASLIRGQAVDLARSGETDHYGRTRGTHRVPAGEVGAILMREGLALAYRPGRMARQERADHWWRPGRR